MGNVFVTAEFEDDVLKPSSVGDLRIVKCQNAPHESAAAVIGGQLRQYCLQFEDILVSGSGNMNLNGCTRRADTAVRIRSDVLNGQSNRPRVLVEVEFENRAVQEAYEFILGYFTLIPSLQSVICFAFYPKREDGTFAAVAIHYRRGAGGMVIEDAVSFGSADICHSAYHYYPAELKAFGIRRLPPLAPNGSDILTRHPWSPQRLTCRQGLRPHSWRGLFLPTAPWCIGCGAPVPAPNCEISL